MAEPLESACRLISPSSVARCSVRTEGSHEHGRPVRCTPTYSTVRYTTTGQHALGCRRMGIFSNYSRGLRKRRNCGTRLPHFRSSWCAMDPTPGWSAPCTVAAWRILVENSGSTHSPAARHPQLFGLLRLECSDTPLRLAHGVCSKARPRWHQAGAPINSPAKHVTFLDARWHHLDQLIPDAHRACRPTTLPFDAWVVVVAETSPAGSLD